MTRLNFHHNDNPEPPRSKPPANHSSSRKIDQLQGSNFKAFRRHFNALEKMIESGFLKFLFNRLE